MEWKWIVYGVLGLGLFSSLFDILVGVHRVIYKTEGYGFKIRSTPSYFAGGVYGLLFFATLTRFFYWNYIGEFWTLMIACLAWLPLGLYLLWRIYITPESATLDRPNMPH